MDYASFDSGSFYLVDDSEGTLEPGIKYTVYTWIPPAKWCYWHYHLLFGAVYAAR